MMVGAIANLLLNVIVAVLLCFTIGYCWLLNKRIKILQDSRSELAKLLKHFDESTQRASDSIIALQTASKKISENIQFRIDKVNFLMDDLAFMIEKGNKVANQLEASFAVNRARNKVMTEENLPEHVPVMEMADDVGDEPFYEPKKPEKPPSVREKTAASLEAVLGRVSSRPKPFEPSKSFEGHKEPPLQSRPRSRTEQELMDLIKSGMKG